MNGLPEGPEVDGHVVGQSQQHLGRAVEPVHFPPQSQHRRFSAPRRASQVLGLECKGYSVLLLCVVG